MRHCLPWGQEQCHIIHGHQWFSFYCILPLGSYDLVRLMKKHQTPCTRFVLMIWMLSQSQCFSLVGGEILTFSRWLPLLDPLPFLGDFLFLGEPCDTDGDCCLCLIFPDSASGIVFKWSLHKKTKITYFFKNIYHSRVNPHT